jgi:hypothetical protein
MAQAAQPRYRGGVGAARVGSLTWPTALLSCALSTTGLALSAVAFAQEKPEGDFARAERLLKSLVAKAPEAKGLHLVPDPTVTVLLDSDATGPRIRLNPAVLRTVNSRYSTEDAERVVTVIFARFIGQIQAGQPIGGDVLYTLDQIDEASCRAVRLLGKEWYTRYLIEVFHRDPTEATAEVERLLSKCS